jgi:hypothetical protein
VMREIGGGENIADFEHRESSFCRVGSWVNST